MPLVLLYALRNHHKISESGLALPSSISARRQRGHVLDVFQCYQHMTTDGICNGAVWGHVEVTSEFQLKVFWVVTLCNVAVGHQRFVGSCSLHPQGEVGSDQLNLDANCQMTLSRRNGFTRCRQGL